MLSKSLHICIVTSDFPGLTETFITNKVLELSNRGYKITVIKNSINGAINSSHVSLVRKAAIEILIMHDPGSVGDVLKTLLKHPITFFQSLSFSLARFKTALRSKLQLKLLTKHQYDIIHFEFSGLAVTYLESIKQLHTKTVVSCRGTAEKVKPLTDKNRKEKLSNLFANISAIHCVSHDMANTVKLYGATSERIFVNTPAIDTSLFARNNEYQQNNGTLVMLTIGRFTFQKGYLIGLMAMKELQKRGVSFHWIIVGDGPQLEEIIYHIHALQLNTQVQLVGKKNRDEILQLYNSVDLFFLPSVYEGIANVCLEAMSMELPLVSTKSGGMEEVINHGENGLLCEVYDTLDMANKIESIANNYDRRLQLGKNARETVVNNFTLKKQVDFFEEQYHLLVKK